MIRLSALTVLLAVLSASSYASPLQGRDVDLRIPSPWRSAGSSRSSSKRKAISKAAASPTTTLATCTLLAQCEHLDLCGIARHSGTKDFRQLSPDAVADVFERHPSSHSNKFNDDILWWGFAAIFQNRTYADPTALIQARENWAFVSKQQVSGTSGNDKDFT
ncbi:hypothetical protein BDV98DRAFT_594457 [Pterulicium gracile]|uniref:Uncharacterized protein n=1 Tax=Pterulicium gracile TaxID=1884261 RepID=A0A5C3QF90_9AGAR|nr:hypothetical protein BDV98DRAFT_594457 [Pterula gracilis]